MLRSALLGLTFANLVTAAFAQVTTTYDHTFVSAGSAGSCTRSSPCGTLQAAYQATNAGGVITILDPGDFGALGISKSLTLRTVGSDGGVTRADPGNASVYNIGISAGPNDVVTLEGLHLSGLGGILYESGGYLNVMDCVFGNGNSPTEAGILVSPSGASRLSVTDTKISNYGSGTGGGIVVKPRAGGSARVNLERVTVNGNAFGVALDGSGSTIGINVTISDSMIGANSQDGVVATSSPSGAPIGVLLTNVKSVNNGYGIRSIGSNVTVRVKNSDIAGNGIGLATSGGGALLSAGNNIVEANATNGSFTGSVTLK